MTLLNDDGQRRAFAARARARAERFSARNMALELVQAYEEVLAARAPQGAAGRDRAAAME